MYTVLLPVDANGTRVERAVDVVTSLPTDPEKLEVVILNVFKEFNVTGGSGGVVKSDEVFDADEIPAGVQRAISLLEEHGITPDIRREHGNVTETIVEIANEIEANQIVMAGRGRSPVGKALFGSTVQGVLRAADQPVTMVTEK
jgi:nucleotide-binding universal stress UspA family protein